MTLVEDYEKDQASSGLSGSAYCKKSALARRRH
jgi:hypothetical protein